MEHQSRDLVTTQRRKYNMKYTSDQVEDAVKTIVSMLESWASDNESDPELYRVALNLLISADMSYLNKPRPSNVDQSDLFL